MENGWVGCALLFLKIQIITNALNWQENQQNLELFHSIGSSIIFCQMRSVNFVFCQKMKVNLWYNSTRLVNMHISSGMLLSFNFFDSDFLWEWSWGKRKETRKANGLQFYLFHIFDLCIVGQWVFCYYDGN